MTGADIEERRREIRAFFRNGEFFRSYDLAVEALAACPGDWRLAHIAVLSLANAGALDLASAKFQEFGLDRCEELDVLSLRARILKDEAFGEEGERCYGRLRQARALYESAYHQARDAGNPSAYYPGINAATTALLAGERAEAAALAAEVLAPLKQRMADPDWENAPDKYWILATALEANLVLGHLHAARDLIEPARAAAGMNYTDLSSTGRQLRRILAVKGIDLADLGVFAPPTIIHYVGHIIAAPGQTGRLQASEEPAVAARIGAVLDGMRIGAAYGSLAAGSDLLFAEALLARGVELNVVLPFNVADMLEQSVRRAGEQWVVRFEACLARARVRYATEDAYLGDDHLFTYCSSLAMGLAVLRARHMQAPLRQVAVWDGEARSGVAGTVSDMKAWANAGHPQTVIRCGDKPEDDDLATYKRPKGRRGQRDTRAMLFGDFHGFSRLSDAQLPVFAEAVMGALGAVIDRYRAQIAFVNTWGDGLFAVFADAGQAAGCALALQEAMGQLDLAALHLTDGLKLRLGGHLGPVYELPDPIMSRSNYYGAHVSRAARIEPITPEGCVYVTETFAAVLALHNADEFSCDYVGYTPMAKDYGQLRIFLLRRPRGLFGPARLGDIEQPPLQPTLLGCP
jgi:class 3 adenylate cyclase